MEPGFAKPSAGPLSRIHEAVVAGAASSFGPPRNEFLNLSNIARLSSLIFANSSSLISGRRSWGNGWGFRVGATGLRLTGSFQSPLSAAKNVLAAFGRASEFTTAIFSSTYAIPFVSMYSWTALICGALSPKSCLSLLRKTTVSDSMPFLSDNSNSSCGGRGIGTASSFDALPLSVIVKVSDSTVLDPFTLFSTKKTEMSVFSLISLTAGSSARFLKSLG